MRCTLLLFSYLFYAWGEPFWVLLLAFSSVFDYANGLLIAKFRGTWKAKAVMVGSVLVNFGMLAAFKYGGFIYDNINLLISLPFPRPEVDLPIGISFYTFQTVSYTLDVYRNEVKAQKNFVAFMMFVSMFPQLVAGPIERYNAVESQLLQRDFNWDRIWSGVNRFAFGLFKKVFVANATGALVAKYLEGSLMNLTAPDAWIGIALFSIQLYFDFSGYSDMAIGLARMFGFELEENFRHPYAAISVADFYRRWHISLGRFFRDYVYIPLGGNRRMQDRNIFVVWALTGLWHGASWNFVMWGLYFGVFMLIEKYSMPVLNKTPRVLKHIYTLILIVFSRSIFYYVDFGQLKEFWRHLFYGRSYLSEAMVMDLY
ncbi:MAG: MBOAT family O-acyltransferase, partial [Bacteroidia bacterium]